LAILKFWVVGKALIADIFNTENQQRGSLRRLNLPC
jgi:hypothetical protein